MKPRIVVSVINNLTFDQRVEKTNATFYQNGYDIFIIGTTLRGKPKINRPYKVRRMPIWFQKSFLLYAEFNIKLFFNLLFSTRKNDILWANDLDSLVPNYLISKWKGLPLIFDSHELFSELPSVQGRFSQKVWRWLEKRLIAKPHKVITVSDSIAHWMEETYSITKPDVIKNLPKCKTIPFQNTSKNYILYQGVLNNGRGLKSAIESMNFLPNNLEFWIAGKGPYENEVQKIIKENHLEDRVKLLGRIPPEELIEITQNARLGLSLEEDLGLSYRFSLPNKLFDYIQAKIPVVSTYLPEIQKIVSQYKIGEIIDSHKAEDVAQAIKKVLENDKSFYKQGLEAASKALTWESQEEQLLECIQSIQA